jgi:NADPH:quinone reductase-like Zn-dependent oxidoreductase
MKEAIVSAGPRVKIVDSPIPQPGPNQVVIRVVVSGSNPKDWYGTLLALIPHPSSTYTISYL